MKISSKFLLTGLGLLTLTLVIHARPLPKPVGGDLSGFRPVQIDGGALTGAEVNGLRALDDAQLAAFLQVLAATPVVPTNLLTPRLAGTFWSLQQPNQPPFPGNVPGLPAWKLGDGSFLLSDLGFDYHPKKKPGKAKATSSLALTANLAPGPGAGVAAADEADSGYANNYTFDRSRLWLEITNAANGVSGYSLHHATNQVYVIQTKTNLMDASWTMEQIVWPTDTNSQPFTLQNIDRPNLFVRVQDWTGVDSDGDGVPDWWSWQYFGTVNLADTNLDYSGNGYTFAQEYSNNITPTVFTYTGVAVTNNYVGTPTPAVQLNVTGMPYYVAVAVDDTNYAGDAVWQSYTGTNVPVNLGGVEGWHDVWIGLRGHADAPSAAVWQWTRLNLSLTAPQLVITNPTSATVSVPLVQVQGYSSKPLASISYDLTNAAGSVSNQLVLVEGQAYDTAAAAFTTNYFQGYDILLANGVNTLTLHATDLAGNMATLTTNWICAATNPPTVALLWPQAGMQISGGTVTLQGRADDPTAAASLTVTDANGDTNQYNGLTGRDGVFWLQNIPLNFGTNYLALTLNNATGSTTTNFSLIQVGSGLTINPVAAGATLVTGIITNGYTVWVNGNQATNNGAGTWTAQITPLCIGGGLVQVTAIPDGGGESLNTQSTVQPPQGVFLSAYHYSVIYNFDEMQSAPAPDRYHYTNYYACDWVDGQGGTEVEMRYIYLPYRWSWGSQSPIFDYGYWNTNSWLPASWPQAMPETYNSNGLSIHNPYGIDSFYDANGNPLQLVNVYDNGVLVSNYYEQVSFSTTYFSDSNVAGGFPDQNYPPMWEYCKKVNSVMLSIGPSLVQTTANTEMKLATGGPLGSTQQHLWCLSATATDATTGQPIPPQQIQIGSFGNLDTNGNLYVVLPDNDPTTITPTVPGNPNYTFGVGAQKFKNKPDWQAVVQQEIDNDSSVQIENYQAGNGFMANRTNIQAVYAFYQKLFTQNQNFLWAGLAKLAGAPVYAGLSDAQNLKNGGFVIGGGAGPAVAVALGIFGNTYGTTFQNDLIGMNIAIMNDLAWQFEAYKNGGLQALEAIFASEPSALDLPTITAWRNIDQGIQNSDITLIQDGNKALLQREQQTVLAPGYSQLSGLPGATTLMTEFAENPVDNISALSFSSLEPSGNIANYPDRWDWITRPFVSVSDTGMWPLWLQLPLSTQLSWVEIPLKTRAADYSLAAQYSFLSLPIQ